MSDGENKSNEANLSLSEQNLEKLNTYLDDYERKIGLIGLKETDISFYLSLDKDKLKKLAPEECGEGAYLLNLEALYVQHEVNKHQAQLDWAKASIDSIVSSKLNDYGGRYATYDTRRVLAIKDNTYAVELDKIVKKSERIIARLAYVPNNLKNLASVLLDYQHAKLREIKGEK